MMREEKESPILRIQRMRGGRELVPWKRKHWMHQRNSNILLRRKVVEEKAMDGWAHFPSRTFGMLRSYRLLISLDNHYFWMSCYLKDTMTTIWCWGNVLLPVTHLHVSLPKSDTARFMLHWVSVILLSVLRHLDFIFDVWNFIYMDLLWKLDLFVNFIKRLSYRPATIGTKDRSNVSIDI